MSPPETKSQNRRITRLNAKREVRMIVAFLAAIFCLNFGIERSPYHGHNAWHIWVREPLGAIAVALCVLIVWDAFRTSRSLGLLTLILVSISMVFAESLITVLKCAKSAAKVSQCISEKKQQALAMLMYATDNGERLPLKENWQSASLKYGRFDYNPKSAPFPSAMNASTSFLEPNLIENSSVLVLLFDTYLKGPNAFGGETDFSNPHVDSHGGEGHVAFPDGHAKRTRPPSPAWTPQLYP